MCFDAWDEDCPVGPRGKRAHLFHHDHDASYASRSRLRALQRFPAISMVLFSTSTSFYPRPVEKKLPGPAPGLLRGSQLRVPLKPVQSDDLTGSISLSNLGSSGHLPIDRPRTGEGLDDSA